MNDRTVDICESCLGRELQDYDAYTVCQNCGRRGYCRTVALPLQFRGNAADWATLVNELRHSSSLTSA